jgi:hypothetical protein
MAKKDLVSFADRTAEEQQKIASAGGKKSGEVRRKKKDLKERFKIALEFMTKEKADALKKAGQIEKAELVKEIGLEVYSMLEIANGALTDEKTSLAAWNDIMDRTEGKPVQKNILDATVSETHELSDREKELINRQIQKEAKKITDGK